MNAPAPSRVGTGINALVVLVVDDDAAMRTLLEIYLKSLGYQPLMARDGDEAVRLAQTNPDIRVMIMDVVMSGLSGQRLVDAVKTALPGLRILFCSGHSARAVANSGIDMTQGLFMQKPCRPLDLKHSLELLLAGA